MGGKTLLQIIGLFCLWAIFMLPAYAVMSVQSNDSVSIDITGTIEPLCRVRNNVKSRATNLDLSTATMQKTNNVFIWCNTGQSAASATYESENSGNLVNENGNTIPYLITVPKSGSNLSLATPQTITQRAGNGVNGSDKGRVVKVKPQVNGFEYAGTYRDTIKVTISYN